MLRKSIIINLLLFVSHTFAYVPEVTTSKRPVPRPSNLSIINTTQDGVFKDGKLTLSISFYDEGVFFQRQDREQLIPITYYLKNEYPKIDFSAIQMTSITINSKTMTDYSHIRFYSQSNMMLKESFIPKIDNPNEVFGDYINSHLTGNEINNLLYVGVSGYQKINNVSATFKRGTPNFSLNLNNMPQQGGYVGSMEGLSTPNLSEEVFEQIMAEVEKMNGVNNPPAPINYDNERNPRRYANDTDDQWDTYNPSPRLVPYRGNQELIYNTQLSYAIGKVGLFGGKMVLSMPIGNGSLTGYQIERKNGKIKYTQMGTYIGPYQNFTVRLTKGDSNGNITFFFSSLSKNATPYIEGGR